MLLYLLCASYNLQTWLTIQTTSLPELSLKPGSWAAKSNPALSPYSLYASGNPSALISPVVLKGDNYTEWATHRFLMLLRKTCFIDGSLKEPEAGRIILKLGCP